MYKFRKLLIWAGLASIFTLTTFGQGTAFTYQGNLNIGPNPANGLYDLQFGIYDAVTDGNQQGSYITNSATPVSNGLFTVTLDFGNQFPGAARWLDISVCTNGGGTFVPLAPRQALTSLPYSIQSANAGSVAATNISGALSAGQLPSGIVTNGASGVSISGAFLGDGSGLTLNASQLTSGTVPSAAVAGAYSGVVTLNNPEDSFSGRFTGSFSGIGIGLNSLDASQLTSGTVPSAALSGTYSGALTLNNVANSFTGSFSGNGNGLTNLNASQLTSGTVPGLALSGTYMSPVTLTSPANSFSGNGTGLTGLSASQLLGTVPEPALAGTYGNAITFNNAANSFSGNGSGLTSLNASQLSSGTVPDVRLSANVALRNSPNAFSENLTVTSGSVGIGINNPQAPLHVNSGGIPTEIIDGSSTIGTWLDLRNLSGTNWLIISTGSGNIEGAGKLVFEAGSAPNGGTLIEPLVLTSSGDVGIGTSTPQHMLQVGNNSPPAYCDGGSWVNASDRNAKEDFAVINPREVLEKVTGIPITEWRYKSAGNGEKHMGPMAQDFHEAFGLNGGDDTHISTVDEGGVALAAIQGLNEKVEGGSEKVEGRMQKLEAENAELKARLEKLERIVGARKDGE